MSLYLGIDIGGTFTDFVSFDSKTNKVKAWKNLSTPENPFDGVLKGIKEIEELNSIKKIRLGTTIATNAILQRKGANVAYITTKGFRDIPFIQRGNRKSHYDMTWIKSKPLVSRRNCFEIDERINHKGEILKKINDKEIIDLIKKIKSSNDIQALAVNFLFSYINPIHELRVKKIISGELKNIPISTSFEVLPKWKEYERASTTIADAYLKPLVKESFQLIEDSFKQIGYKGKIVVMQSNGGENSFEGAIERPVQMTVSGPTGGVVATRELSKSIKKPNIVSLDMGGTSTDCAAIIDFKERFTTNFEIEWGLPIQVPMIDVRTIGAGGGSIAWIDKGGLLQVGPQSAGANPGPACYSKGGTYPTVTDANVVLGRLNPNEFLGGSMEIDYHKAEKAISEIAQKLNLSLHNTANAIIQIANNSMVGTLRTVLLEKGFDPRDFSLLGFGGAGPLHVNELMALENIPYGIVPLHPGQFSAFGFIMTDARVDRERTIQQSSKSFDIKGTNILFSELESLAVRELIGENKNIKFEINRTVDLRYLGQNYELKLNFDHSAFNQNNLKELWDDFHLLHKKRFNFSIPGETIEMVNLSISVVIHGEKPKLNSLKKNNSSPKIKEKRDIWFKDKFVKTSVYERSDFFSGQQISGPAVIIEPASTTLVLPDYLAKVDDFGNIHIYSKDGG